MDTFFHRITLVAPSGATETLEALVDTGAMFATIPTPVLERLGVRPQRVVRLRLANGEVEARSVGEVFAGLDGERATIICVFGAPEAPPLIGAHALEAFLLAVDPVEGKLVPKEAYLMCALHELHTLLAGLPWSAAAQRTCTSMEATGRLLGTCDRNS